MSNIPPQFIIDVGKHRYPTKSLTGIPRKELPVHFKNSILDGDMTLANLITAEMIVSGYHVELWNSIFELWVEYIHLKNIDMVSWLLKNYRLFISIKRNSPDYKNQQEIRNMMAQTVSILCIHPKLRIEIKVGKRLEKVSALSQKLALAYSHLTDDTGLIDMLAQFIECYNQNALKRSYHWIREIQTSSYKVKKECNRKNADHPIWIIWTLMSSIAEKKEMDFEIFDNIKEVCLHHMEYSLLFTYIMVSYIRHFEKVTHPKIDVLDKRVIKTVMCVNYAYQKLISQQAQQKEQKEPVQTREDFDVIIKPRKKPANPDKLADKSAPEMKIKVLIP